MNKALHYWMILLWLLAPSWARSAGLGRSYNGQTPEGYWIPWTFSLTLTPQAPTPGQVTWSLTVASSASLPGRDQECAFSFVANGVVFCQGYAHAPWVAGGAVTYTPAASGVLPCAPGDYLHIEWGPQTTDGWVNGSPEVFHFRNQPQVKLPLKLSNPTSNTVTFKIHSGGALLHTQTLGPGASITYNQPFEDNGNVTITQTVNGLSQDGFGSLYLNPAGNVTSAPLTIATPGPDGSYSYSDNVPGVPVDSAQEPATVWASIVPSQPIATAAQAATAAAGGGGYKPIWTNPATVAGYDGATDLLTNSIYREGVQNLVNRDNLSETEKMAKRANDASTANAQNGSPAAQADTLAATWSASEMISALPSGIPSSLPDVMPNTAPPGSIFDITMPAKFGGKTVHFNPFTSDRLGGVLDGFRTALAWLLVATFALWAMHEYRTLLTDAAKIPQIFGLKPIIAGESDGGFTAGLLNCVVIAAAFLVLLLGLTAAWDTEWSVIGRLADIFTTKPFQNMPGGVVYMLDQVFPIATCVAVILARIIFYKVVLALFLVWCGIYKTRAA